MINQDFSNQNLRGHSFKGQNLEGANFSHADIRGANFTNAYLRGANFSYAKAGLQKRWLVTLTCISWIIAAFSGFLSGFFVYLISAQINDGNDIRVLVGWFTLIVIIIFSIFIIREGLTEASALALVVVLVLTQIFAGAVALIGVVALIEPVAFALVLPGTRLARALALAVALVFFGTFALAGVLALCLIQANADNRAFDEVFARFFPLALALAVALVFFDSYIAWRATNGDEKYSLIWNIAIVFAAMGGTSFRNANLTDAHFTGATLKSTDLRDAILIRTRFSKTESLNLVRPGKTYLQNTQLRQFLITGQGENKNFDRQDLRGVNLQAAILTNASFIDANLSEANLQAAILTNASFIRADLSEANLQDADLSKATLVQSQLNATDFTGATLTGACIEDWGITKNTKLNGVRCEYVYMRLETEENPDPLRKPDNNNEVFADGDFGDFIKPIFDTLDLYHNQKVDPRAFAISYKKLAEEHPDAELDIVAIEKRSKDNFLIRVKTAATADKSQLSKEYYSNYDEVKGLSEVTLLLKERDNTIRLLKDVISTVLQRPSFYSSTQIQEVHSMTSNLNDFSIGGSVGGNVNNVQDNNNRTVLGDNNQALLGDGNQVTQQNQVGATAETTLTKDDIIKLFAELEGLIKKAELPQDTKEEVIEDLGAAKKATDKEEPNKRRALARLTSVTETLEKTSKSVEAGQKIWTTAKPIITKVALWLGAAAGSHLLGL